METLEFTDPTFPEVSYLAKEISPDQVTFTRTLTGSSVTTKAVTLNFHFPAVIQFVQDAFLKLCLISLIEAESWGQKPNVMN